MICTFFTKRVKSKSNTLARVATDTWEEMEQFLKTTLEEPVLSDEVC